MLLNLKIRGSNLGGEVSFIIERIIDHAAALRGSRKDNPNKLVGKAIRSVLEKMLSEDDEEFSINTPLIRGLAFRFLQGKEPSIPEAKMLGVVSPEIMEALVGVLPEGRQNRYRRFLDSLRENPHPLREKASVKLFAGGRIQALGRYLPQLLSSLQNTLPTSGNDFRDRFLEEARVFGANLEA